MIDTSIELNADFTQRVVVKPMNMFGNRHQCPVLSV